MSTKLTREEIRKYLLHPECDPRLVAIVKRWRLLDDDQRHEIAKIMTRYVLKNQSEELEKRGKL